MAHRKIYQISKKPVEKTDWISESRYFSDWGFVGSIAEYVDEVIDEAERKNAIEELGSEAIEVSTDGESFKIKDRLAYFKKAHENFTEKCKKLSEMDLEAFAGPEFNYEAACLSWDYIDKYGDYIDDNGEYAGLETFDEFMRRVNDGDIYYIGAIIDYKY